MLLPPLSVISKLTEYLPIEFTSTLFSTTFIFEVKSPSSSSLALTPSNGLNLLPNSIVLSDAFIIGNEFSFSSSFSSSFSTVTVIVLDASLPLESLT